MNSQQELLDAINTIAQSRDKSCDTPATVLRVEGDTVWVHIDGGADETPVQKTINCSEGETVQVRISNGSAFLVGNASAPPTDDTTANVAHFVAEQAEIEAANAQNQAIIAKQEAEAAAEAARNSIVTYETWYMLSATTPTQPTEESHTGWSTVEPAWSSSSTDNLYFSIRTVKGNGTATWSAVGMVQSYADLQILKNAIISTVASEYVAQGDSNVTELSSTMLQNENGVNIYNDTLAVGDSYAHIDGDSFDIKVCTTAGEIDDTNDGTNASFGREITVGSRKAGQLVGQYSQVYGHECVAQGDYSYASGYESWAYGDYTHTEGYKTKAYGYYCHAEGYETELPTIDGVVAMYCHAEGKGTKASGLGSHAEGKETKAFGEASHAEGSISEASGDFSHAQNLWTLAQSKSQTAIGKYNIADANNIYALIIGNGANENTRSDALRVKWDGSVIDGNGNKISPTILTSSTISASTTSYTFSNSAITTSSVIDVYDSIFGFAPTNISTSAGRCTITFPAQSSSHQIKLFIY